MFVANDDKANPVKKVIPLEIVTMRRVDGKPAFPKTQPKRRYMTTPSMVKMLGVKTPLNAPNR